MERASRLLRKLGLPRDTSDDERIVCAAWGHCVGRQIASHTRAVKMVRKRLVVEVEDDLWKRQLFGMTGQILAVLEQGVGHGAVEEVEFRAVPRRREPNRAITAVPSASTDEAAEIADPILRSIYRASRRKALA